MLRKHLHGRNIL
ncbi:hypothetical protein DOY81_014662, partial [Sarcophaga bullata]